MIDSENRILSIILLVIGVAFILLYPMTLLFPDQWMWEPRQAEYEQMIIGVYFVLGVFAVLAAREPLKHLSLIWFICVSNLVHGLIMAWQAQKDPVELPNMIGDVPALIIAGLLLLIFTPKKLTA